MAAEAVLVSKGWVGGDVGVALATEGKDSRGVENVSALRAIKYLVNVSRSLGATNNPSLAHQPNSKDVLDELPALAVQLLAL